MKTTIIRILLVFAILFTFSCTDNSNMLTVINPDGSCYREFESAVNQKFLIGDSIDKYNTFPVDIDSSWQITWRYENSEIFNQYPANKIMVDSVIANTPLADSTAKEGVFYARIKKNYASIEQLAENFKLEASHEWSKMDVSYALERNFRWFYTYYTYRETYPKIIITNFEIPLEKYLAKEEIQFWFIGQPDDLLKGMNGVEVREYIGKMEDKYNVWYGQNIWNNEFKCLLENYEQIKNKPVSIDELKALQDTIFFKKINIEKDFKMRDVLNDYFNTNAFSVLWEGNDSPMSKYEKEADEQEFMSYFLKSFDYKLVMPGEITQCANAIQNGDTLTWKLTAYRMVPDDYSIEAQSRKANIWAFIVTGLLLIIAVVSLLWKPKK